MRRRVFIFGVMLIFLISTLVNAQQTTTTSPGITPDSFLWGLDRALEQISLLLATSPDAKATKGLEIANERLAEVKVMIEENKLEAAQKAEESRNETLLKVKENIKELDEINSTKEIKDLVEIEKEINDHEDDVEEVFNGLKVKIKIEGNITEEQRALINSFLAGLQGQTGEIKIEIENKKDTTKIKIKQETGKSDKEIDDKIEEIEKESGVNDEEKASKSISKTEEKLNEFLQNANEKNITVSQDLISQVNSLIEQAKNKFDKGNFIEARKLAKQARELLDENETEESENNQTGTSETEVEKKKIEKNIQERDREKNNSD